MKITVQLQCLGSMFGEFWILTWKTKLIQMQTVVT